MSLQLTICAAPASISLSESSKTFETNGGTLGRGKENTWVLDDPERYLSSLHCQISSENGQYYLTDLSTNGTFLNGGPEPMGKGRKLPLNDGDKFALGDYEFSVSVWTTAQPFSSSAIEDPMPVATAGGNGVDDFLGQDPFSQNIDFDQVFTSSSSPFDSGYVPQADALFSITPEETDPLLALDKARGGVSFASSGLEEPLSAASYSDQADPICQQISWPESVQDTGGGIIPDDWDEDLGPAQTNTQSPPAVPSAQIAQPTSVPPTTVTPTPGRPKPVKAQVPETVHATEAAQSDAVSHVSKSVIAEIQQEAIAKANEKISAELKKLKQQVQAQQSNSIAKQDVTVDTSLVDTLGFHGQSLTDEQITQINAKAGEVIRESIKGLMQVLSSRSAIKNEFRMNVTTIQPVENNPLKFSANVDDALENMFLKQGNAYKKPIEAVQEGFDSIAEHQVAIIAGIRAAFKGVIERFDPLRLEERFSKGSSKVALIPGMQKARNWDLYSEYYTELVGDLDNSFQYLFGDEFVQAYEDQLRKLAMAKKAKSKG